MRITTNNYYSQNPQFGAWQRNVYKSTGAQTLTKELAYRNDTSFFRDDLLWDVLVRYLKDKYSDVSKVNIYNYACSNGSEAFSIIMKLLSAYGEKLSEKFFPIIAKDVDSLAISNAKSNSVPINWYETSKIKMQTNDGFEKYFIKDFSSNWHDGETSFYCPTKLLTDRVQFSNADILKDYKNIKAENSVVFARNFWPYLEKDIPKLIARLSEQLGKNSTIIIGNYDIRGCKNYGIDLKSEFAKRGFIDYEDALILEKI